MSPLSSTKDAAFQSLIDGSLSPTNLTSGKEGSKDPDFESFVSYQNYLSSNPAAPGQTDSKQSPASKDEASSGASSAPVTNPFSFRSYSPTYISPYSSTQDSHSTSSKKRKISTDSSKSSEASNYTNMADDANMEDWKPDELMMGDDGLAFGGYTAMANNTNPLALDEDFEISNKAMGDFFDMDNAAISPSPQIAKATAVRRSAQPQNFNMPYRTSPKMQSAFQSSSVPDRHFAKPVQTGFSATAGNSREESPLSGMLMSHQTSPSALFPNTSPSPSSSGEGTARDPMIGTSASQPTWTSPSLFDNHPQPILTQSGFTPSPMPHLASPFSPAKSVTEQIPPCKLILHPTPLKTRVETQIPIRMTLYPLPPGVTKLHLPTHSISKPKLKMKPTPERSRETLELSTVVVCTSAMVDPEKLARALARAAGQEPTPPATPIKVEAQRRSSSGSSGSVKSGSSDANDPNKPLNGGEIKICEGCMERERRRAERKKVKKPEEEDAWLKDAKKRVVIFNTNEIKEWTTPVKSNESVTERPAPEIPDSAVQIEAPMRIACYCRHHSEKSGFQVIFTIKDWEDRLIAQAISTSIMITDDHKTSGIGATNMDPTAMNSMHHQNDAMLNPAQNFAMSQVPNRTTAAVQNTPASFRMSHSHSDLQTLQQQQQHQQPSFFAQQQPRAPFGGNFQSPNSSATIASRNLSRHASPTGPSGPSHKKRKSSIHNRIPAGLAMTRVVTDSPPNGYPAAAGGFSAGPSSATYSGQASPFTPNYTTFAPQNENPFMSHPTSMPSHVATGPPTPAANDYGMFSQANRSQSMENLARNSMFSAPPSARPSRPSSPTNVQRNAAMQQQAQAAAVSQRLLLNQFSQQRISNNPSQRPTINKLVPTEGPTTGGVEITCLGSGFTQGLEVMFGDTRATTTTYWSEASIVCLLPPAKSPGLVPVSFTHQYQQAQQFGTRPTSNVDFKYNDGSEVDIQKMALTIVGAQMNDGAIQDPNEVASQIVSMSGFGGGNGQAFGSANNSPSRHRPGSYANGTKYLGETEALLLGCLDMIDMDENPAQPMWEHRNTGGQTILHLACALGYQRFVAALLARGVNPEPRDNGGFTPMHFAALHNHSALVRRLLINGADPSMRSLAGYQPANLATSDEALATTRKVVKHTRARSRSFDKNLSQLDRDMLKSLFERQQTHEDGSADKDANQGFWLRSRRNSMTGEQTVEVMPQSKAETAAAGAAAAMASIKKLASQLQTLPQNAFSDYQKYLQLPTRRISSLVGREATTSWDLLSNSDAGYTWKELLSPPELPKYDELFPEARGETAVQAYSFDDKKQLASQAAADTVADQYCVQAYDTAQSSTVALPKTIDLRRGSKKGLTEHQREQIRAAHVRKIKRIRSDRTLFFFWIPALVFIIVMIALNRLGTAWSFAGSVYADVRRLVTSS